MATTTTISTKELQRIAALAYEGETLKVMLCQAALTGFNAESTVAQWQTAEISGSGYVRYSTTIGTGAYNSAGGRYELPVVNAGFTASSVGYNYDRVVLYIDGETNIHSIIQEDPNIVLQAGQNQTYRIQLVSDD
jgi:hydrogenase maturation factor